MEPYLQTGKFGRSACRRGDLASGALPRRTEDRRRSGRHCVAEEGPPPFRRTRPSRRSQRLR
ncbi:hypothetical protein HMPREF0972_02454 [Actinomyces sp. oral taxon 848 str. F0332]|nr:hypothetical protein HMPREF0972_02454 [Actinomyces sp. oral taxon 848 str. F0332]